MRHFYTIFFPIFIVLFVIHWTSALQCYTCTASLGNNFRCENLSYYGASIPYNTCYYGDAVCAKYIIEYGDSLMIHRSCQHSDICHVLAEKYNNYYSNLLECQICNDRDFCNSGHVAMAIPLLVVLPAFIYRVIG